MAFYYHTIYSPETNNQDKTSDYIYIYYIQQRNSRYITKLHTLCMMSSCCRIGPSCCPPGSPMGVSPLPLLQINCLSCSPQGGPGPPSAPLPIVSPFPSGSTHSPISPSATVVINKNVQHVEYSGIFQKDKGKE
jgi:hypothetical protein